METLKSHTEMLREIRNWKCFRSREKFYKDIKMSSFILRIRFFKKHYSERKGEEKIQKGEIIVLQRSWCIIDC